MRGGKIFTYFDTRVNTLSSLSSRICLSYCAKEFNDRKNSNFLIEACVNITRSNSVFFFILLF